MLCEHCQAELQDRQSLQEDFRGPKWRINGDMIYVRPVLRRVFRILWLRRNTYVSREALMTLLYGLREDPPFNNTLKVYISTLRKILKGSPYSISRNSMWNEGWMLTDET